MVFIVKSFITSNKYFCIVNVGIILDLQQTVEENIIEVRVLERSGSAA